MIMHVIGIPKTTLFKDLPAGKLFSDCFDSNTVMLKLNSLDTIPYNAVTMNGQLWSIPQESAIFHLVQKCGQVLEPAT